MFLTVYLVDPLLKKGKYFMFIYIIYIYIFIYFLLCNPETSVKSFLYASICSHSSPERFGRNYQWLNNIIFFVGHGNPLSPANNSGKPSVSCEICGKKLADPSSLYRHRKIHSGDKPHKCPYCTRRFIQRWSFVPPLLKKTYPFIFLSDDYLIMNCKQASL